jgi:hypothetical protein
MRTEALLSESTNGLARLAIERAARHWREIEEHIAWCDERIAQHGRDNAAVNAGTENRLPLYRRPCCAARG